MLYKIIYYTGLGLTKHRAFVVAKNDNEALKLTYEKLDTKEFMLSKQDKNGNFYPIYSSIFGAI